MSIGNRFRGGLALAVTVAMFSVAAAAQTAAGIFESHGDVGVTPKAGSVTFDSASGEYSITGGGANIWAAQDAFQFAWRKVTGDVTLSADVRFIGAGAVAHRKAVLMIRQDLTPDSAYADIAVHGSGLTSLQYRPAAAAQTAEVHSAIEGPVHVRIERRGNQFTVLASKAGEPMVTIGPQTVDLSGPVYVGLGVCSHDANVLETAVFSNVRMEPLFSAADLKYRSKIAIYDLASRKSTTLYQADHVVEAPNWSRDGRFLLFNSAGNLYRLPLGGTGDAALEKIDLGPGGYRCNNDHDLSKDGKLLAFSASTPGSGGSQVWLAAADGSGAKRMTPAVPSYFHGWSPDGKWLAFVGQRAGKFTLFRVPVTGGDEQPLTTASYDDGPDYSPDGKWIYFNSNRSGGWDIWRIPADGAGPNDAKAQRVTSDELEDWFPHISPDGKWMLVFSFPKGTTTHNDRMDGVALRLTRAPAKKVKPAKLEVLTTFFGGQGSINVNSWSPDSKQFAYVIYEPR